VQLVAAVATFAERHESNGQCREITLLQRPMSACPIRLWGVSFLAQKQQSGRNMRVMEGGYGIFEGLAD
jgi:hypothetical protein